MSYYEENKALVEALANCNRIEEVHGTQMLIKDIPDPISGTVLDPRVYERRKKAALEPNPLAECVELPVDLIREMPSYTGPGANETDVEMEELSFESRNGKTSLFCFTPKGGKAIKPAILYIHGGAYIAGSTKAVANFCKLLAEKCDAKVFSVEYRLAPEYKFPIGALDCYDAFNYIYWNAESLSIDRRYIALSGDSAGSTLALDICIYERQGARLGIVPKNRICYQALIYPGVIITATRTDDYRFKLSDYEIPEDDELAVGAALSLKAMVGAMGFLYTGEEKVVDPIAAPLLQEDYIDFPKTTVALCEYDYLRLSGEAFARKLDRDGVEHRTILYKGMDHSFIDETGRCPQAYDLAMEIAGDLKKICEN